MEAIRSIDHAGLRIDIFQDEDPQNPRDDCSIGTLYIRPNRYFGGDRKAEPPPKDALVVLPISAYIHSGVTIWAGDRQSGPPGTNCQWDSAHVGHIWITAEAARKDFGWKRITKARKAEAERILRQEVETFDRYLRGDVYGFKIYSVTLDGERGEELDSLWGCFGLDYALEEAKSQATHLAALQTPLFRDA